MVSGRVFGGAVMGLDRLDLDVQLDIQRLSSGLGQRLSPLDF